MIRWLFRLIRLRGDARAIQRGRYPQRLRNRAIHRAVARYLRGK